MFMVSLIFVIVCVVLVEAMFLIVCFIHYCWRSNNQGFLSSALYITVGDPIIKVSYRLFYT